MVGKARRAGLTLGAIGTVFAVSAATAGEAQQDLRSTQALLEAPLFLSLAEIDAAFSRLDADRPAPASPIPNAMTYWESGGVGFGQSERAGRLGSGASATQMRFGADRELRPDLFVGAMASAGFGRIGSGDLGATAYGRHADFYARFTEGRVFAKALVGASQFGLNAIERGSGADQCRADASNVVARASGQIGAQAKIAGVSLSPTLTMTAMGDRLSGYSERGAGAASFSPRAAAAALGAVRIAGARSVRIDARRKLKIEGFVGADEVLAFRASAMRASVGGERVRAIAMGGAPTGRGLVGGLGVGVSLTDGVTLSANYDYGRRDGVSTRATRGRLGVSF